MEILLAGFLLGISLIVALGPQNILLIRQGILRHGVTAVVLICFFSDAILIPLGTFGSGLMITQVPGLLVVLQVTGVLFLGWFALSAFRDALFPQTVDFTASAAGDRNLRTRLRNRPALAALALTWLNPIAYVDTFVVLGGIANQYGESGRWLFTAGALLASLLWFPTVGYGAAALAKPLSQPRVWRIINAIFGIILTVLTVQLALK